MPVEIILIILFTLFSIFVEKKYKQKKNKMENKIIPSINPAELKYNYEGLVNERDLTSIIIQLAQKGYIKITPDKIVKQKKYKEKIKCEQLMYNSLFKKGNCLDIKNIHINLYKDISDIVHSIDNKDMRTQMNESEEIALNNYLVLFTLIIFIIIYIHLPYNILKRLIITIITWISFISLIRVYTSKNNKRSKIVVTILTLIVSIPFYIIALPNIINDIYFMVVFITGYVSTIIIINVLNSLTPKTKTGTFLKSESEKFNNYLISIDKEKVNDIIKKNSDFLEKTFPYAYAFNHTFKWKRLLKRNHKKLKWYDGDENELTDTLIEIKRQIIKSGHKE